MNLRNNTINYHIQSIYDEAQKRAPGTYWTGDGVHASLPGAQLMAEAWLSVIK